jgi:HSP20 family protein
MMIRNSSSCCLPPDSTGFAREVDRALGSFFGAPAFAAPGVAGGARVFPPLDVWETPESFVIRADVPGIALADLDLTVVGGEVTIAGGRERGENEGVGLRRRERAFGRFTRTVAIDADIDSGAVSATLKDGVLTVTLPKGASAKPRKITVNEGATG